MEEGSDNCLDITEVLNKPLKLIEALEGTPVSTHTWSSGPKKRGREEMEDSEEIQPLKMNRLEEAEPTTTAVEGEEEEEEGSGGGETETGEAEAALSPIEEAKTQEAEVKGELTDDQGNEEEVATQEPDAVLENRTTEEDVDTKEEDSIEAKDTVDAAPVASEELAETETVVEKEAPLLLEEPASATEKSTPPAEPAPAEPCLSGEVIEEAGEPPEEAAATPMEGEEVEGEKEGAEKAVKEEEKSMEAAITVDSSRQETVVQVGVADLSYQPPEEGENQPLTEEEGEEEAREEVKGTKERGRRDGERYNHRG
ncbi:fibrous sheath CABYR-binding protein-like [Oncorhynchus masou masou]|uniref:fibrous sheath CABYR-binding protein-like n=1 Tax=Oncorhynchus masou masou TaxID=90313 RepID=UPI00318373CB